MSGTINSVRNSTLPTQADIDPKDIADSIIRNELERRSVEQQQYAPDIRPLENTARTPLDLLQYEGIPLGNPHAKRIIQQMIGELGGGRT